MLIALVAAATERIRVGSGAVQTGHVTAPVLVEQFGTIDALHPGRVDLGLGRSGHRKSQFAELAAGVSKPEARTEARTVDGLLIPPPADFSRIAGSPTLRLYTALLQQQGAEAPEFAELVDEITALIEGTFKLSDGTEAHIVPGEDAELQLWILGSSGGESARVAGERGLPFAANYHVAPSAVLEAVEAYREAFKPSAALPAPHVMVSADVVVAPDDETARRIASPYALWVLSVRDGRGAIPFPTEEDAAAHVWTDEDRALVADRVDTQFVGSPQTVADRLRTLQRVTGADELLVTTIVHDHTDRLRSFELLAEEWNTPQ
ncbi:LLM class flavin-dependent oxidoreductase [Actinocorallia aurantiaca]|uniref:LLM class flavin-dependent oxidoreductase n=1 Tax=Actinocorallia aurantiaca TaxID=46204 RepID=A0ABP6GK67_9ACTN